MPKKFTKRESSRKIAEKEKSERTNDRKRNQKVHKAPMLTREESDRREEERLMRYCGGGGRPAPRPVSPTATTQQPRRQSSNHRTHNTTGEEVWRASGRAKSSGDNRTGACASKADNAKDGQSSRRQAGDHVAAACQQGRSWFVTTACSCS